MIRTVQIVPQIDKVSSGPSLSVPLLSQSLQDAGLQNSLMVLEPQPEELIFRYTTFFPYASLPLARPLGISPKMKMALMEAAKLSDVFHTHSLWKLPNIYPDQARRGTDCKLVVSPRGTLSNWALSRSQLRKKVIWYFGQKAAIFNADCIHATSASELEEIRRIRDGCPVAVVPNGVQCPDLSLLKPRASRERRVVLFLARIHPTKGVDVLLDAWRSLGKATDDWELKIAGPNNHAFAKQMQSLSKTLGLKNVTFIGEVVGEAKSQTFVDADLYVLPTHSENFGISVAEALAHAVPAIVFEGAPWSGLNSKKAGWWIPQSTESLTETLRGAMAVSDQRRTEMGQNGRLWVEAEFDWSVVGRTMADVYRWMVYGGEQPKCVDIG